MLVLSREASLRDLIGQFEDFEMSDQPMVRLLRFHQHLSQLEDHRPWLINALQDSMNSSLEEKLIAAQYLSFLEAFHSDHQLEDLDPLRQQMLEGLQYSMLESQGARHFIGTLSREEELVNYMAQARTLIQELTRISDLSTIWAFLDILVKHMEWKAKRKVLLRQKKTNQNQFIHNLIDFFTGEYGQREEILSGMARLAAATMNYLKEINYFSEEDSNPINRKKLIRMRQAWLNLTIYKREVALDICKTITASFNLLGLQSERAENKIYHKIYNFLQNNENCINQSEYLELLLTFLNKLEGVNESKRSEITKILSKLLKTIILGSQTSTRISYRSKAMMSDLIIKISSLFTCEPSRQITKLIRPEHSQNQLAFIGALLVIFDTKMSNEYLNSIPQNRWHIINITKQHVLYKLTLRRYCDVNFDFSQSIINPEIREQLMWDLLLLRITIETNYNALTQLKKIQVLIINLIKMILLNCLPDQCYEIIEKLIQKENIYTIRELSDLPLIKIIQDVKPILFNQVRDMENPIQKFNTLYRNLFKVITLLSKNHNLNQIKQPALFIRVLRINSILNDYAVTPQLMKSQKQLLSGGILLFFENINRNELFQAVNELIDQIERHKSLQTFLIFLEVMNRSRPYPFLHPIYTELNAAIENVIKQVSIPPTVLQSYRILSFLLSKPNITSEVVKDAWELIRNVDSYHYIDQFHSVIQLHKYSDNYVRDKHNQAEQINYLVYQIEQIVGLLNNLEDKLDNTAFLVRIEELTRYKLAILDYSLQAVTRYTKANGFACNQTAKMDRYLHIAFNSMRETPELATLFNIRPGICIKWSNCQFYILLLIGHLRKPRLCFSERPIPELIKDLDQKRELLRKIYPQEYRTALKYYSRLLNCKTIELPEELRAEEQQRR